MDVNYTYDGRFNSNVLIVGQMGCGKTTFILNLAKNKIFGTLKEVYWLSKITLSRDRQQNILSCFEIKGNFNNPQTVAEFYAELDLFQKNKADSSSDVDTVMGEKNTFNKLIVI